MVYADMFPGDYLVLWNDDCILQTKGWDAVLAEQEDKFRIQMNGDCPHSYALLPIKIIDWYLLIGYFSPNYQNDACKYNIQSIRYFKPIRNRCVTRQI